MLCTETEVYEPITVSRTYSFSFQITAKEGFAVKGEMNMETTEAAALLRSHGVRPIYPDVYDDVQGDTLSRTPRSALRASRKVEATTDQLPATPKEQYAFTGVFRKALWVVLACLLFFGIGDGLGYPAWQNISNHLR